MSIFFLAMRTFPTNDTKAVLDRLQASRKDIMQYFWISDVSPPDTRDRATADEYDFPARSVFLVRLNADEGAEFVSSLPQTLYEVFGNESLIVFDIDREPVPKPTLPNSLR